MTSCLVKLPWLIYCLAQAALYCLCDSKINSNGLFEIIICLSLHLPPLRPQSSHSYTISALGGVLLQMSDCRLFAVVCCWSHSWWTRSTSSNQLQIMFCLDLKCITQCLTWGEAGRWQWCSSLPVYTQTSFLPLQSGCHQHHLEHRRKTSLNLTWWNQAGRYRSRGAWTSMCQSDVRSYLHFDGWICASNQSSQFCLFLRNKIPTYAKNAALQRTLHYMWCTLKINIRFQNLILFRNISK